MCLVEEGPKIDGRLDEGVWYRAGIIGPLVTHPTYFMESLHPTEIRVLYTDEALYLGARCQDAHPESLVVTGRERDHEDYDREDFIEFLIDRNFDHVNVVKISINSTGTIVDAVLDERLGNYDYSRNFESAAAAHVGPDFWSLEYRVEFGAETEIPMPRKGERWGVDNIQRGYRNRAESSLWTRDYPDVVSSTYSWFLFQ